MSIPEPTPEPTVRPSVLAVVDAGDTGNLGKGEGVRIKPPWWFCNGWWSPWCVIDTVAHDWFRLPLVVDDVDNPAHGDLWLCRKHDAAVERKAQREILGKETTK